MISKQDSGKFDNLRFRPFLVIESFVGPAEGVRTERKGWKKGKETQRVSEYPTVVDRITKKLMCRAEVIIDIVNDRLLKNRLRGDKILDAKAYDSEIFAYYKDKYANTIKRGRDVWVAQQAVDDARLALKEAQASR